MNIQIFGKSKCFDTKKAERWFKERRVKFQSVDVRKYGMSRGELASVKNAVGLEAMVDPGHPDAVLLRNGKNYAYDTGIHFIGEKKICESTINLMENDMLVLMTDGITNAGIGKLSPGGWKREEVIAFLERWYTPDISPQNLAARLVEAGNVLCMDSNDDDMTALVFKVRPRRAINVMIGPPADPKDDARVLKLFFAKEGSHICCGGSTAHMISRYLNKPIIPVEDSGTEKVPAIATIDGMDLVTEGIITLQQVADLAEQYVSDNRLSITINSGNDGVSLLCAYLFEQATDINFFFGKAENTANDDLDIGMDAKAIVINRLISSLREMGKNVKISRC